MDSLLDASLGSCDEFLLALTQMELRQSGKLVLLELSPFLLGCEKTALYPAGYMLDEDAITVCRYRLTADAIGILKRAARHLYAWQEPELPNDLCILRSGEPWLVTTAADEGGSLYLDQDELVAIQYLIPALRITPSNEPFDRAND